jgi:deazaflavin-dependent oxidoreductase (nitroreductase family)
MPLKSPSEAPERRSDAARRRERLKAARGIRGPTYIDGAYVPERRHNPLLGSQKRGGILSAMQLPLYSTLPPKGTGVLTTAGRKTGKLRPKCVRVIRKDNRAYLVAIGGEHAGWLKNIRKTPRVKLHIRGGTFWGTAHEVQDDAEREEAREAFIGTVVPWDYMECGFHRRGRPTRQKIQELHTLWFENGVPVIIDLKQ